jgi:hypothetical protein
MPPLPTRKTSWLRRAVSLMVPVLITIVGMASAAAPLDHAISLYSSGKFAEAAKFFAPYADQHPRDKLANYYAALSKAALKDPAGAARYMSRVAVYSYPDSSDYNQALNFFRSYYSQLDGVCPYSCLANGMLVRWNVQKKPLRIFVSDGWQLPQGYGGGERDSRQMHALETWCGQRDFYRSVGRCAGYDPEMRQWALWGLGQWDWAKADGLLKYEVVTDPTRADILVFWYPQLPPGKVGYTTFTIPGERVIIELQTKAIGPLDRNATRQLYVHTAAHEFGHAFGMQHSHTKTDLMAPCAETIVVYIGRGVGKLPKGITKNDKATMRTLYTMPADHYFTQGK